MPPIGLLATETPSSPASASKRGATPEPVRNPFNPGLGTALADAARIAITTAATLAAAS